MESLILPLLKWLQDSWGPGAVVALVAIGASGWICWKAKDVLIGITASNNALTLEMREANRIALDQQHLCRRHAESQGNLIDSMTSLINEVHIATTSGNRVQEHNMKNVLDLLERQMDRNLQPKATP